MIVAITSADSTLLWKVTTLLEETCIIKRCPELSSDPFTRVIQLATYLSNVDQFTDDVIIVTETLDTLLTLIDALDLEQRTCAQNLICLTKPCKPTYMINLGDINCITSHKAFQITTNIDYDHIVEAVEDIIKSTK